MNPAILTRCAPAPTGYLHIGHVVNALQVWGFARRHGGRVLLRIEDHDGQRSRREYEDAILEDLAWLGFAADGETVRQSERTPVYEASLDRLRQRGLVYACDCSRRQITDAAATRAAPLPDVGTAELWYPGTCADRHLPEAPGLALRVRLPRSEERFTDLLQGPQLQVPSEQCGDLLVRDRHGYWTYQFAVTVDDHEQGITHVIRGVDLLASTGRQIQLARMLGRREPPVFMHHGLVMKLRDQKVSKSDGDTGIREMRARGMTRDDVLAAAARFVELFPSRN